MIPDSDEAPEAHEPPLGLRRLTVRLVEHQPAWLRLAAEACDEIRHTGGDLLLDVQHVGSTAVADLAAKPILDIVAAVADTSAVPELIDRLAGVGYIYHSDAGTSGGHLFIRESAPDVRTVHLHIVTRDDVQWANYLRFRDMLIQDSDLRERYGRLKAELEARHPDDRPSYTAAKHDFIQAALGNTEENAQTGE
jgi:GrpB-like predicted nucleotidyltransferase (UPF0157 family)